jgi:hypothetical protein
MELVDHDTHESLIAAAAEGRRVIAATRQQAIEAKATTSTAERSPPHGLTRASDSPAFLRQRCG